ncbi:MAG: NAD(P)H-hydrate epimerase [Gammaproteobacteria bacterium]|nr:NAD(P)H-hydrate epimerase [Gammaproteobacteria bacterium]
MNDTLILNRRTAQALDRHCINTYSIPSIILMENAGRGVFDYLLQCTPQGSIVICCGKGNNGGDGFVVARHLDNHRMPVHILLLTKPDELKGDAKTNYEMVMKSHIPLTMVDKENMQAIKPLLSEATWIVDALFGTGLQGSVGFPFHSMIQTINEASKEVLSIDIPSGLDCDTGEPLGVAIKATHTVTMVGLKKGFLNPNAQQYLGCTHIVDIGVPNELRQKFLTEAG